MLILRSGFPFSFGVFQNYYSTHAPFSSEGGIAVIGTCAMVCSSREPDLLECAITNLQGVMYLESPFIAAMCQRWPKMRRWYCIVGLLIVFVALVASSFSKHVWHLILTQGVLYAIGGGLIYTPTIIFLDEWFVKRKSLAFGVTMVSAIPKSHSQSQTRGTARIWYGCHSTSANSLLGCNRIFWCDSPVCFSLGTRSFQSSSRAALLVSGRAHSLRADSLRRQATPPVSIHFPTLELCCAWHARILDHTNWKHFSRTRFLRPFDLPSHICPRSSRRIRSGGNSACRSLELNQCSGRSWHRCAG